MIGKNNKDKKDARNGEIIAFLGKDTEFKGIISYNSGTIRIDGKVEGEIITKGTLIVGEDAVINGEITVSSIICGGKIIGNVNASEKVQLRSNAVLNGSIKSPVLTIEEGVYFNGDCEMKKAGEEKKEKKDSKDNKVLKEVSS
ncbi:MAG: polymer-forming cytoskeletal protein [Nitrospirota bacterium]